MVLLLGGVLGEVPATLTRRARRACGPIAGTRETLQKTGRKRKKRIEPRIEQIGGECETDFRPKEGILDPDGG